jgi:PAS domain S-box-containing protein
VHNQTPDNDIALGRQKESDIIRIVLDKSNRIGFASSSLEHVLGLNYETIVGTPISALLPEFAFEEAKAFSHKARMHMLRSMSEACSYAVHANGEKVPVTVTIQNNENEEGPHLPILLISRE